MKDRLITLAGGLLALYLLVLLLVPSPQVDEAPSSWPLSTDPGPDGLLALRRWLEQGRVPLRSLQTRYDDLLTDPELASVGNLLLLSLPQRLPARPGERLLLHDWLAQGNSALILVARHDAPDWSRQAEGGSRALLTALNLRFSRGQVAAADRGHPRKSVAVAQTLRPAGAHPLLEGVRRVRVKGVRPPPLDWRLLGRGSDRTTLVLLRHEQGEAPALWQARVGEGRVWVSSYAGLVSNAVLGQAQNAALVANLLRRALGPRGTVVFDDMHQGLSQLYDPDAFFADPRLHNTIGLLLVLWLLYLAGRTNRLAPPRRGEVPARGVDLVHAVAGLYARRLRPAAAGRALLGSFFNELRERHGLPRNGEPAWELLEGAARAPAADLQRLRRLAQGLSAGRRAPLQELVNVMHRLRKQLS